MQFQRDCRLPTDLLMPRSQLNSCPVAQLITAATYTRNIYVRPERGNGLARPRVECPVIR